MLRVRLVPAWPRIRVGRQEHQLYGTAPAAWTSRSPSAGFAPVDWLGAHALYVYRGPLVHLLVTYPSGRLVSLLDRAAVAVGYAAALVTG